MAPRRGDDRLARCATVRDAASPWVPPAVPTLVIVPHPDDEVLGCGGLIAHQCARGTEVTVCAVTDGEAAYTGVERRVLAETRRQEQADALASLGLRRPAVRFSLPDGGVARYEAELVGVIARFAGGFGLIVAPWLQDHHTDHDACGRASRKAAQRAGVPIVHSLFWAWQHATVEQLSGLPLLALRLDDLATARRRRAMACHKSQISDVFAPRMLGTDDLEPLRWPAEYYVRETAAP